jgi:hypothetical protein
MALWRCTVLYHVTKTATHARVFKALDNSGGIGTSGE